MSRLRWRDRTRAGRVWIVAEWVLLVAVVAFAAHRLVPRLGDLGPAPDARYRALDGQTLGPPDFRGQVVVLNVWATWCPPCVVETPGFVDLSREFAGDVQFLGVSADDDPAAIRAFVARHGVPYPVLVGPAVAGMPPRADVLPTTLVIDRRGRVRVRHEGLLVEPALRRVLRRLARE